MYQYNFLNQSVLFSPKEAAKVIRSNQAWNSEERNNPENREMDTSNQAEDKWVTMISTTTTRRITQRGRVLEVRFKGTFK